MEHVTGQEAASKRPQGLVNGFSREGADVRTLSIDLNNLFSSQPWETGSFNLKGVESTSLGKLLDALPIPALLLDESHCLVYRNNSWSNIAEDAPPAYGESFTDMIACSNDTEKTRKVFEKATDVLAKAFRDRKPAKLEVILKKGGGKKWARLHLRSVRIASRRYLLALIEDVTVERTRERLGRIEEQRLRRLCRDLQEEVRALRAKVREAISPPEIMELSSI
jgi:hypothetical protein